MTAWLTGWLTAAEDKSTKGTYKRLADMSRPEAKLLGGALVALIVSEACGLAFPFAMGRVIDDIMPPGRYGGAAQLLEGVGGSDGGDELPDGGVALAKVAQAEADEEETKRLAAEKADKQEKM